MLGWNVVKELGQNFEKNAFNHALQLSSIFVFIQTHAQKAWQME